MTKSVHCACQQVERSLPADKRLFYLWAFKQSEFCSFNLDEQCNEQAIRLERVRLGLFKEDVGQSEIASCPISSELELLDELVIVKEVPKLLGAA